MSLGYPNRRGFAFSIKSLEVRKGSELFKGLLSFKVAASIEGREYAEGTGMIAYSKTRGALRVEVEMEFEGTAYSEWVADHPNQLVEIQDVVMSLREGSQSMKVEIIGLTLESIDLPIDGTAPVKVALSGSAFDCRINDQSLVDGDALGQSGEAGAS